MLTLECDGAGRLHCEMTKSQMSLTARLHSARLCSTSLTRARADRTSSVARAQLKSFFHDSIRRLQMSCTASLNSSTLLVSVQQAPTELPDSLSPTNSTRWLKRIGFKTHILTSKISATHQLTHLYSTLFPFWPTHTLHSSKQQLFQMPYANTEFGLHSFSYYSLKIHNESLSLSWLLLQ